MLFLIESLLIAIATVGAFAFPTLGANFFARLERLFARLARRRGLAVLTIGFLALGLRVAVLPIEPFPEPISHDEWGHLLAADTFAHWRLTNPTHLIVFAILLGCAMTKLIEIPPIQLRDNFSLLPPESPCRSRKYLSARRQDVYRTP
jgi:hypothetical protein